MRKTPLTRYFSKDQANKIKKKYKIGCMEQLVSIAQIDNSLEGFAKSIGMRDKELADIISQAEAKVSVPIRSGRKYPLGVV